MRLMRIILLRRHPGVEEGTIPDARARSSDANAGPYHGVASDYLQGVLDGLRYEEALRFIDDCERRRAPVLGLEWFHRQDESRTHVGIADVSGTPGETDET